MSENLIDKFAPYPRTEAEATAQNVYRHLLVSAQVSYLRFQQAGEARRMVAVELFISNWSTLHLLRHVMGLPSGWVHVGRAFDATSPAEQATADDVARDMWIGWEDGGGPTEVLWDWLVDAGIDPKEIGREFEKVAEEEYPSA